MKGVIRLGKKGNLSPRYIGPYRISKRLGHVACELELPSELAPVHSVFYISMLKKCMDDPSLTILIEDIGVKDNLSYKEGYRSEFKKRKEEKRKNDRDILPIVYLFHQIEGWGVAQRSAPQITFSKLGPGTPVHSVRPNLTSVVQGLADRPTQCARVASSPTLPTLFPCEVDCACPKLEVKEPHCFLTTLNFRELFERWYAQELEAQRHRLA
ncbi:hypothetical protein MTR67_043635 [Solanum verrucosum]|uniref:Tf2-1-like SH3-like domain-containing protein n=1 Tax=Solanum verrucosum TaxID=315347 RepID=A0AAF0UQM6_SOLVR|nr:hypothetical protein MTR67_043635 [Solanum verrucosum]